MFTQSEQLFSELRAQVDLRVLFIIKIHISIEQH